MINYWLKWIIGYNRPVNSFGGIFLRFTIFILATSLFIYYWQFFIPKSNTPDVKNEFRKGTIEIIDSKEKRYYFGADDENYYYFDNKTEESAHSAKIFKTYCEKFDKFDPKTWCDIADWETED